MSEPNETRVFYRAIADFAGLRKELAAYRRSLATTKAAEAAYNTQSAKDRAAATKASTARAKALDAESRSLKSSLASASKYALAIGKQTTASRAATKAIQAQNRALLTNATRLSAAAAAARDYAGAQKKISAATGPSTSSVQALQKDVAALKASTQASKEKERALRVEAQATREATQAHDEYVDGVGRVNQATGEVTNSVDVSTKKFRKIKGVWYDVTDGMVRFRDEASRVDRAMSQVEVGATKLHRGLKRFGDWRPRLVPPFIALVPIIGAVVAAINPLVSLIGSLGPLTLGLASNIGSLSGAFLALPGILSGVVAGIGSVIASMGGVGNVFKTYSAMQKATGGATSGGGGGGPTQAERAEALADAEWNLAKAQRNVTKAQENLNKAREEALQDLIDLRMEVSRASLTEERAIADLRRAQEDYWDVMADPGSTLGDKLDAAASIKEAEADLQDVRQENIKNQKALTAAEAKGVNGSEKVLDAQENLTDAINAQRDAQRGLNQEVTGSGGGSAAVTSINEYNEALAKLSPSARKFVLAILAMQDQWKAFRLEMQETFFSQFVNELDRLPRLLTSLTNFLRPAAAAMGQFVSNAMQMLDTPAWSRDLATIGEQNGVVITKLGEAGLSLATALKDIVVAAGPFTEWMVTGFAEGADNFERFVSTARETGSLAGWLDKVRGRLEKWWQIIKNVASTLFNYSAASSNFGDWISDNLVEMTAGWAESAKKARDDGSDFQTWLEDVKPLLGEVNGLFGDFFAWFREESMDPENIKDAQELVRVIRDDLGPAFARLLDVLAETDIDEKFVTALADIIDSLAIIMEKGGGEALSTFFDVVEGFFSALADVAEALPPEAVTAILSIIGALAGIAFVGKFTGATTLLGGLLGLGSSTTLSKLSAFFGKFKALNGMKFLGLLGVLGLVAAGVAANLQGWTDVFGAAEKAGTAAEKGDVVGATAAATDNGTLAKAVTGTVGLSTALGWISPDLQAGFDSWMEELSSGMMDFFLTEGPKWQTGWNQITGVVSTAGGVITGAWQTVYDFFTISLPNFFTTIGSYFQIGWGRITGFFHEHVVLNFQRGWNRIVDFFTVGVPNFFTTVGENFQRGWNRITGFFTTFFTLPVSERWNWLAQQFQKGLTWISTYVIAPFQDGFNRMKDGFNNTVTGLSNRWNDLRRAFADPVNFVINEVYNNGIRKFWNGINDSLNLKMALPHVNSVRYAEGGVLPGYTPGRDVHNFTSPTGGRLALSGGEAIMRPEWTKAVGGPKAVEAMNRKARSGQAFAKGGVFNGSTQAFAGGGVWEVAGDIWDKFSGLFSNPLKYIADGANAVVAPMLGQLGSSPFGNLLKGIPSALISGLGQTVAGKVKNAKRTDDGPPPPGTGGGAGMGWRAQWEIVRKAFPGVQKTSDYRPNDKYSWTHSAGRAIDLSPSMEVFNWLRSNFPSSQALIYSPANGRQLLNGRNHMWGEPERSMHYNHVHWAMANGGVLPNLYDNGGWLQHGQMGLNLTGKPEAVLDPDESRALKSLLSGAGLMARPGVSVSPGMSLGMNSPQRVVDNSVNIGTYTVQNPVPEKASVSLPKAIRQVGYMNNARANA